MPEQPAAEKTEQPTRRKLQKAREKGQVPQSQELPSVATLVVLVIMTALLAPSLLRWFALKIRQGLAFDAGVFTGSDAFIHFINAEIVDSLLTVSPILAALSAASLLASMAVSGLNFAPESVKFKWNSINPATGLQKLVNVRSLVSLIVSIAKLLFVSLIVWLYLKDRLEALACLRWAWSAEIITAVARIIFGLCVRVGIALVVIAVAETLYQKWKYLQELKMTRQEVKQEHRDLEGSPEVKTRIRRIQIEMTMRRISAEVPKASVILVNPTHVAVALRYNAREMEAPVLVAKGTDYLAEKIVAIGRAHGIPVIRRPELARTIYATVQPGSTIPEPLYVAVAEVLALIHRLRQKRKIRHRQSNINTAEQNV